MKNISLGLKSIIVAALAASSAAAGPRGSVKAPTTAPQTTVGNFVGLPGSNGVFAPNNTTTPGLAQSLLPNVANDTFPGAKYEGGVAAQVLQQLPAAAQTQPQVQPQAAAKTPVAAPLEKSALSNSGINQNAFAKNAASPAPGAPVKTENTGIAAVDNGLAQTVGRIQARKQEGAGGARMGTDQGDLDKLFEQIGKRNSAKADDAAGAVALKDVEMSPEAQVKGHAAQAVRSMAEAQAAGRAGEKSTQIQRVSEAGQFIIKARAVVRENEIPPARVAASFAEMKQAAAALGPDGVALLADAAIAAAGRADKNAAFDYGNQFDAMNQILADGAGRPYIAGYGAVLNSLKRGLAETVGRTEAGEKRGFAPVEVELFSGASNPRVRLSLPAQFAQVVALNQADFVESLKLAPDAVASLDEGLGLANEGAAMHAALNFTLNTQGFADHKSSVDAELARRGAFNPMGLRGFFIAARRYLSESAAGLWRWILSILSRFGFGAVDVPAFEGLTVSADAVTALRTREAAVFALPERLPTADFAGYSAIPVH